MMHDLLEYKFDGASKKKPREVALPWPMNTGLEQTRPIQLAVIVKSN